MKKTYKRFNTWCANTTDTFVSINILHGEITPKQIGFWRRGKANPNLKSQYILKKYGFDWKFWDEQDPRLVGYEKLKAASEPGPMEESKKQSNRFTVEFEYVHGDCPDCDFYNNGNPNSMCLKYCKYTNGNDLIVKRIKKYVQLTRKTAIIDESVRHKEHPEKTGTISYVKKNQNQCVIDWGGYESTIAFEHLEVEED